MEICFGKSRKHCVKRRKCRLPAFSPFHAMFSKGFFFKVVKCWDCARMLKQKGFWGDWPVIMHNKDALSLV